MEKEQQNSNELITESYSLYCGDCLEVLSNFTKQSINLVIIDPPYGQTPLKWDSVIPFKNLWECLHRIIEPSTPILIFGQEPFSSYVRISNISEYKYDWYWEKERLTNVFQVKRRPGKTVETISVFYDKQPIYNPQKNKHDGKLVTNKIGENARWSVTQSGYDQRTKPFEYHDDGTRHPTQVLRINRDNPRKVLHPTQKPVKLLEYLIKTYTDGNGTVLDPTMGSGSTGIACLNTGRKFVGIELDTHYFEVSKNRLESWEKKEND